jgi:N-acetylneuraminic acid mutarotase
MYAPAVVGAGFVALVGGLAPGVGERGTLTIGKVVGGEVTSWFESGAAFANPRTRHGVALDGESLYVFGGITGAGTTLTDVQSAKVTAASVTPFATAPAMPAALARAAVAQSASAVYVVGGTDVNGNRQSELYVAQLTTGGLTTFVAAQPRLPSARSYAQAIVYGSSLIVVGGEASPDVADVLVYPIAATGELGAPTTTTSLPRALSHHQLVRQGEHLYVIGGSQNGVEIGDVYVGDVTKDGTVTGWRATTPLPRPLVFHAAAAL